MEYSSLRFHSIAGGQLGTVDRKLITSQKIIASYRVANTFTKLVAVMEEKGMCSIATRVKIRGITHQIMERHE